MASLDPRDFDYERIYNKVPFNLKRLVIIFLLDFIVSLFVYFYIREMVYVFLFQIVYMIICLKYILIFLIKIYQRLAPISLRSKCRFEPSCSNYLLQCLEIYGLIKGLKKGINRIKRCNPNDGGYDYP